MNLLPFTVYERLRLGELRPTKIVLQLVSRSTTLLKGVVEHVLIEVGQFIFPIDFVVLNTKVVPNIESHALIILGCLLSYI